MTMDRISQPRKGANTFTLVSIGISMLILLVPGSTVPVWGQRAETPTVPGSPNYQAVNRPATGYNQPPSNTTPVVPEQTAQKTFQPRRSKADELVLRYLALLPLPLRQQTRWTVDAEHNSFTVIGPSQAIAIADEMIPRMDANMQLVDGYVDVGVVQPEAARTGTTGPASTTGPGTTNPMGTGPRSVQQLARMAPPAAIQGPNATRPQGQVPKVQQYYDPNENRVVRVAMQAENAILPMGPSEMNLATFGARSESESAQKIDARTPDIVVYRCDPARITEIDANLRTRFAQYPELVVATDARSGRIFTHTTRELHEMVRQYLGALGIQPESPALEQYDTRVQDGIVTPISGMENAEPPQNEKDRHPILLSYSPKLKKSQDLERLVRALFGDRLSVIEANTATAGNESLTRQEPQIASYRFTRRKAAGETSARTCDLQFDFKNQKVLIAGDPVLCRQMTQLFQAMDRQTPVQGNVRRFISIRQSDPKKIKEILDFYYTTPGARIPTGRINTVRGAAPITSAMPKDGASASPIRSIFRVDQENARTNPIRQTAWQDDGLSAGGPAGPAGPAGPGAPGTPGAPALGDYDGQGLPGHGVGIVQDYMPQVLPDLDVVIIDAPEAEYKRIENMIREIEELAKLAEPKIEIYNLKHVNCVMLQGILQQLHREMFVTKQGRVVIFAMQSPNAILIVGWGQAFASMKDLINVFDQPIADGADMIRVIRLQYAPARDIALQLATYFPTAQPVTGGFSPRIRVFPDVRTNSLVVHAAPNDMVRIQQILTELDVNKAAPRLRVKTFTLKNLLAEDLRKTITNAILPSVAGTSDGAAAKYPILEILSVDAESKRLIESGIMTDVNIVADRNNNQLIVTAPEDCMELLEKLIGMLDIAPAKAQIKIFRVVFGDASQMTKTLLQLIPTGGGNMPAVPNADGENTFVPVRFAIDTRTNCIIATASPKDLKLIEALVLSLDRKDTMERKEVVFPLRNVQALSIAKAIDDYLSRKQDLEIASEAMSVYQMFESQVIVVPESITNSLIISATPRYLDEIVNLVESFDKDPPQVVIQVLIAEVTLTDHEEFGIEAGLQDTVAFDRSVIKTVADSSNSTTGIPGFDMVGTNSQGNNMSSSANQQTVAGQLLNSLGVGRTSTDVDFGGLVVSASSRNVQVTLRALREKDRLQVLSRPQITAMDNQQAFILLGQRVPRVDKANMTNYGITSSVTDANVGLILLVTPRISKEGRVIMEIGAEKSSLAGDDDAIPVFSSGDQIIKSPSINTIQAMTAVSAMDGETVMLGGLITSSREKRSRGIPWLSDIPHIGWLFRYDKQHEERKELLIVLTPRVVKDSNDVESVKRIEASKMNWCLSDAMAINGSMGLHDPLSGQSGAKTPPKHLPFLERSKMEAMSDSSHVYSPQRDYPPKTANPATGTPATGTLGPINGNSNPETLPGNIYQSLPDRGNDIGIPATPTRSQWIVEPGVSSPTGMSSPTGVVIPPVPGSNGQPIQLASGSGSTGATQSSSAPNDVSVLDRLAHNGYAFSPKLQNAPAPIRAAGYEESRSENAANANDARKEKPAPAAVPMGMDYSQTPQYR